MYLILYLEILQIYNILILKMFPFFLTVKLGVYMRKYRSACPLEGHYCTRFLKLKDKLKLFDSTV